MGLFSKLDRSADLVQDMAGHLDQNLADIVVSDPEFGAYTYRRMVMACATCTEQDDCRHLLDTTEKLDQAPAYCRNGHLLKRS